MQARINERGNTLVVVIVLLGVLMVLGAGAIRMSGSEIDGAKAAQRELRLATCAWAVRNLLISQLRFAKPIPTQFSYVVTNQGTRKVENLVGGERILLDMGAGHDPSALKAVIDDVQMVPEAALGQGKSQTIHPRITNDILAPGGSGGSAARVTARCRDKLGRSQEIELLLRFGL